MRVILLDPPNQCLQQAVVNVHPLGLGYVAAALSEAHDVLQVVPDVHDFGGADPWLELVDVVRRFDPDLIGIGAVTATLPASLELARRCRTALGPSVPIVLGGVHPTTMPEETLASPHVDYVVRGEGEDTIVELARALEGGRDAAGIPGLYFKGADGALVAGPARPPQRDLDAIPFPRRDGIAWSAELLPSFYQSIITLRGCPYKCIYCAIPASADKLTRYRSPENVADEIEELVGRHAIPYLFFHDSVFTLNRPRTVALLDTMLERGLTVPFACQTRADRVDPLLAEHLRRAGCHQVFFGIESGDAESLRRIKKAMPLERIRAAVAEVKAQGIRCTGFFMIGFPWETEAHIRNTADFAVSIGLDAVSLFSATPLPGTELWELSQRRHIPDSIDFRKPEVNLTVMDPDVYATLYDEVQDQMRAYNTQVMGGALEHWPRG